MKSLRLIILLYAYAALIVSGVLGQERPGGGGGTGGGGKTIPAGASSATISNIMSAGGNITIAPGDYYNISNIFLSNQTVIRGYGATFHFSTNCTNYLFAENTNVSQVTIEGLSWTGDVVANFASSTLMPANHVGDTGGNYTFIPYYSKYGGTFTNRSGILLNGSGRNNLVNCCIYGFPGYGVQVIGTNNGTFQGGNNCGSMLGCIICSNWVGVATVGSIYDLFTVPGNNASIPARATANCSPEYFVMNGCHINANGEGIYDPSANFETVGNDISGNYVGMMVSQVAGTLFGHGTLVGNTINHNQYAISAFASQIFAQGNQFLASSFICIDGTQEATFRENKFGNGVSTTVVITNANNQAMGPVIWNNNPYDTTFGGGATWYTNLGPTPNGGTVYFSGGISTLTSGDSDGSALSRITMTGDGGGLSNTFNGTTNASIVGGTSGVTNTTTKYGTCVVVSAAGTYSNFDGGGNFLYTNSSVAGQEEWPVGPGAGIKSISAGITSCKVIFQ